MGTWEVRRYNQEPNETHLRRRCETVRPRRCPTFSASTMESGRASRTPSSQRPTGFVYAQKHFSGVFVCVCPAPKCANIWMSWGLAFLKAKSDEQPIKLCSRLEIFFQPVASTSIFSQFCPLTFSCDQEHNTSISKDSVVTLTWPKIANLSLTRNVGLFSSLFLDKFSAQSFFSHISRSLAWPSWPLSLAVSTLTYFTPWLLP